MKVKVRLAERHSGGLLCPRPEVILWVRTQYLDYTPVRFVVDTGSDVSAMSIAVARQEGIPFPQTLAARGRAGGLVGAVDSFRGILRVRVRGEEFEWPCDFLLSPAESPTAGVRHLPVLGRAGFREEFAMCVDGDFLFIRRRWPSRPWWYRLARRLIPPFAAEHPIRVPL
jgi:hypothetical protein